MGLYWVLLLGKYIIILASVHSVQANENDTGTLHTYLDVEPSPMPLQLETP